MLSELTRIPIMENAVQFLNQIYQWANLDHLNEDEIQSSSKSRPGTATTRTRPFSAYSRPFSGKPNSTTINATKRQTEELELNNLMNKQHKGIDYSKLKHGEKEFYAGVRSLHPEYEHPKKRLKEYQRKIFYED